MCTDIVHLENKKLVQYRGGFAEFRKMHEQKVKELTKAWEKQEKRLKELKKSGMSSKDAIEKATKLQEKKVEKARCPCHAQRTHRRR